MKMYYFQSCNKTKIIGVYLTWSLSTQLFLFIYFNVFIYQIY